MDATHAAMQLREFSSGYKAVSDFAQASRAFRQPGTCQQGCRCPAAQSRLQGDICTSIVAHCTQCSLVLLRGCAILQLDSWRVARTGAPEVVWGPGKSPEQIAAIMTSMAETEAVVLATRIPQEVRCTLSCTSRALHCI